MKTIVVHHNFENHNKEANSSFNKETKFPQIYTLPDTAINRNGRPFFVPDFASRCLVELHLVFRICRLGKNISQRFAHRYYDAITIGASFTASNIFNELTNSKSPWDLSKGFDGSTSIGNFLLLNDIIGGLDECQYSLGYNDVTIQEGHYKDMKMKIDEIISYVSNYYTLRQGDLIFTGCPCIPTEIEVNSKISGKINETPCLAFNIK